MEGRNLIREGIQWNVGDGECIDFWNDQWVPRFAGGRITPTHNVQPDMSKVTEFIKPNTKEWDKEKLMRCIPEEQVE